MKKRFLTGILILLSGLTILVCGLYMLFNLYLGSNEEPVKIEDNNKTILDLSRFYDIFPGSSLPCEEIKSLYKEDKTLSFGKGWHHDFDSGIGRWMTAKESELSFENKLAEEGYIIFDLLSIKNEKLSQIISVYLNGKFLGRRKIHSHLHSVAFETKGSLRNGKNKLKINALYAEKSANPEDIRTLSIMLRDIKIYTAKSLFNIKDKNRLTIGNKQSVRYTVYLHDNTEISYSLKQNYEYDIRLSLYPLGSESDSTCSIKLPHTKGSHSITIFDKKTSDIPGAYRLHIDPVKLSGNTDEITLINPKLIIDEKFKEERKRPLFFAFYYPWYIPEERSKFTINPLWDDYHFSKEQVNWEIDIAKRYGIDGFCVEYFGVSDRNAPERYRILLDAAAEKDFKIIFFLDGITIYHRFLRDVFNSTIALNRPVSPNIIEMNLLKSETEFIPAHFDYPSYYKRNGIPLVYLYAVGSTWDMENQYHQVMSNIFSALGLNIGIAADIGAASERAFYNMLPYTDSFTFYTAHDAEKLYYGPKYDTYDIFQSLLKIYDKFFQLSKHTRMDIKFFPVIFCGYDDRYVHPDWTQPGVTNSLYIQSYRLAVAKNPEIIFIATWNECTEGNAIIPSKNYGFRFLELHKNLVDNTAFK